MRGGGQSNLDFQWNQGLEWSRTGANRRCASFRQLNWQSGRGSFTALYGLPARYGRRPATRTPHVAPGLQALRLWCDCVGRERAPARRAARRPGPDKGRGGESEEVHKRTEPHAYRMLRIGSRYGKRRRLLDHLQRNRGEPRVAVRTRRRFEVIGEYG